MARFCTGCGKEIEDGVMFCTECGTRLEGNEPKPVSTPSPSMQASPVAQVNIPSQNYSPPVNNDKVISTGLYIGLMILFAIPVIGFIACIIMALAAKNKNIRNYARATLIWMIIAFILLAILFAIASALANSLTDYINQMTGEQFGDFGSFFSEFNEIKDSMNNLGDITNQLEGGDLSNLPLN